MFGKYPFSIILHQWYKHQFGSTLYDHISVKLWSTTPTKYCGTSSLSPAAAPPSYPASGADPMLCGNPDYIKFFFWCENRLSSCPLSFTQIAITTMSTMTDAFENRFHDLPEKVLLFHAQSHTLQAVIGFLSTPAMWGFTSSNYWEGCMGFIHYQCR